MEVMGAVGAVATKGVAALVAVVLAAGAVVAPRCRCCWVSPGLAEVCCWWYSAGGWALAR
jgi:hypothetical protein